MRKDQKVLPYVFNDKQTNIRNYVESMLNRTQSMFIYGNLPETISQRQLELKNQTHGFTIWCNVDESEIVQDPNSRKLEGGLYALNGGFGGIEDLNGDPTFVTIAHPRLKQSKVLKIDEECVLMRNDPFMQGLLPILERYCSMLVENDISINLADIMSRATAIITAGDDTTMENARMYIKKIIDGEISVIGELSSLEGYKGIETQPFMNGVNNTITNLIELQQYLKASMWNDLGLNANWNAKRESINSGESELNHDALLPLIDTMLHSRQEALAKINELFGTNITVELHSAWADVQELHEEQDSDGDMQLDEWEQNTDEDTPEETAPGVEAMQVEPEHEDNVTDKPESEEVEIQPNGSIKVDDAEDNYDDADDFELPDEKAVDMFLSPEDKNVYESLPDDLKKEYIKVFIPEIESGRWVTVKDDENEKGRHIYIDDNGRVNNDAGYYPSGKAKANGTKDTDEELKSGESEYDDSGEEYDPYEGRYYETTSFDDEPNEVDGVYTKTVDGVRCCDCEYADDKLLDMVVSGVAAVCDDFKLKYINVVGNMNYFDNKGNVGTINDTSTAAFYQNGFPNIHIKPGIITKYGDEELLKEHQESGIYSDSTYNTSNSYKGLAAHETGHYLQHQLEDYYFEHNKEAAYIATRTHLKRRRVSEKFIDTMLTDSYVKQYCHYAGVGLSAVVNSFGKNNIDTKVSEYSGDFYDYMYKSKGTANNRYTEWFAETISDYYANEKPAEQSTKFIKYLKDYMGVGGEKDGE